MEHVVSVLDMRYYNQTLSEVSEEFQVILTKNGKAIYAGINLFEM